VPRRVDREGYRENNPAVVSLLKKRPRPSEMPVPAVADAEWAPYCRFPGHMVGGNSAKLLVDGQQAFPAMIEAIDRAERTVLMESYIFHGDQAGRMFAEALSRAAARGVRTHLVVDGVGTMQVPAAFFERLEQAGVRVLEYRPPSPWRRQWGLLRRNHRKLLAVDNRVGFTGGLNVGDEWLPREQGGLGWHDVHVRLEGPAVRALSLLSLATWRSHGDVNPPQREFLAPPPPAGDVWAAVVGSRERKRRRAIRQAYLHAINRAQRYIFLANAYFLPDRAYRRALSNAVARGVDVRVMLPARGDILAVQLASQSLYGRLLRRGVRLFLWNDAVLHAKTAVIDDQWATVGSFNIDHRSLAMNLEVNANLVGRDFAVGLRELFERDEERCTELTYDVWRRRPLVLRFLERFFGLFRGWM
jgi:cardiolipin synthase